MTARLIAVVLLIVASGGFILSAQSSSGREPAPEAPDGALVSVRVTHADGQLLDFGRAPRVRASTTFEGEVTNPPLSANVWLAARTVGGAQPEAWRVLLPPARIEEQGRWSAHVDLPCVPDNSEPTCEVLVFVSRRAFERTPYDEDLLRQYSFATVGPVKVQVLSTGNVSRNSIVIERVSGFLVNLGQPVKTPASLDVDGASRDLNGQRVWVTARCAPDDRWFVLGHTTTDDRGDWHMSSLMLPTPSSAENRNCSIEAVSGLESPPSSPVGERVLLAWASSRSSRVELLRNPYYLAFLSLTDTSGRALNPPTSDGAQSVARLTTTLRSLEIEADPLPADVRVWQALRCDTCSTWLMFGPAHAQGSGRYVLPSPQSRYPARPSMSRFKTMVFASREDLEGHTLTQPELERTALGASRTITIDNMGARVPTKAAVEIDRPAVTGEEADEVVGLIGDVLDVACRAEVPSEKYSVYVGYLDPDSRRWFFHRAEHTGDRYHVTAPLRETAGNVGDGRDSILIPVIAESLPVGRGLEQEWWSEMIVAAGGRIRFQLPLRPWYVRAARRISSSSHGLWNAIVPNAGSEEAHVLTNNPAGWLLIFGALVLTAMLAWWQWQRATVARAILNGWLDARGSRRGRLLAPPPFVGVLSAITEAKIVGIRRKAGRAIAVLRERLTVTEQELQAFYLPEFERLKGQTGRHDASMPLSPVQHRLLLLLLTVGEGSFNLAVFYVFREPAVYTLLMALAVAVSIPICAFSVGLWIRRLQRPWLPVALKLVTTIGLLATALVGLNRVRMAHLASIAPEFVRDHPDLNAAFLSFNALIFLASAMVSYWGHDAEENFAEVRNKVTQMTARASVLRGKLGAAEANLQDAVDIERERGRYHLALYHTVLERHRRHLAGSAEAPSVTS